MPSDLSGGGRQGRHHQWHSIYDFTVTNGVVTELREIYLP